MKTDVIESFVFVNRLIVRTKNRREDPTKCTQYIQHSTWTGQMTGNKEVITRKQLHNENRKSETRGEDGGWRRNEMDCAGSVTSV